jgi:hypothetical protein
MNLSEVFSALERGQTVIEDSQLRISMKEIDGVKFFIVKWPHTQPRVCQSISIDAMAKYEIARE